MMKKILSVALSVMMVLSVLSVPGFAADAVEYTVSNVSYAGEVYDELNDAAGDDVYAMVEGITSIPENGRKLKPSVEISASADTTATVIFAVYTDGVLTNAFYETKAVGATAVEFSKEITVADREKETYKVFVLGADGKAIAPVSNFPVAENALEYMVITYADGTSEKIFGADLTGDTVRLEVTDARRAANPSIKVVPVDNSTEVSIDIDADFWQNGAAVTFAPISGDPVVLKVLPDLVELKYVPTLSYLYAFENNGDQTAVNTGLSGVEASAKFTGTDVTIKVPVGTTALAVKKIEIGAGTANAASIEAFEVSMNGDSATVEKTAGGKTYTFNFVWDDAQPYIYNVTTANITKPKRTVIVRTNGKALRSSSSSGTEVTAESAAKALDSGDTLADNSANMKVKINGTALPNDGSVLVLSTGNMEAGNRPATLSSVISATGKFIKGPADPNWVTFTPSADGTLYVRATQADAMEATYDWDEVAGDASWYVVSDAKLGDTAVKLYAKDFTAGTPVSIPTQAIDADEINFVNGKLDVANVGKEKMYRYEAPSEGGGLPARLMSTDNGVTWTAVENTAFDRYSSVNGVTQGYNSWFIISFNDMPANPDGPGEGEGPVVPPVDPPVDPDVPVDPTPSAAKLASVTYTTAAHVKYTEAAVETDATEAWAEDATAYVVKVPVGTGTVTVSAAADYAETPNALAEVVTVDLAGKDEATAEILGNTVTFKWDDTDPYISEVVFNAAYLNRWSVDFGTDGSVKQTTVNGTSGAGCTPNGDSITALAGLGDLTIDKYIIGIPMGAAIKGLPHMPTSNFNLIANEYPANDASDAVLSFRVSENATVYTRAVTKDNQWEELVAAGWTAEGTAGGKTLYKKTFNKGDLVLIPGTPIDEDEIAALNATGTKKYIQYAPDATIELADGTAPTQKAAIDAWLAANHDSLPLNNVKAGEWIAWNWDAATDKPVEPTFYSYNVKDGANIGVQLDHATFGALPVFYVQFEAPDVPDVEEPEIPPVDPQPPVDPNPDVPPVVDNSANQLNLTFTTALALTEMASTGKYANAVNRVSGEKSIYAGGFYMPMLVSEAVNATVDHEAKTAVVTVPFGTEVVNLAAATVAGTGIDLADNATVVMLNDNGAAKTFDVVAGENTYAVTVKWADAADANMGLASTGADVYGVKYKMADLWAGSTKAYSLVPTTLDMSVDCEIDAAYYEGLGEAVPTEFADGVRFVGTGLATANMTSKNSVADYGDLVRYKIFNDAMKAWVAAGIIADTDDLDGATLVNTGVHYQTHTDTFTASGLNVDMDSYLTFNVEGDGVVYVIPGKKGRFTNDDTWTKVEAETLLARRNGGGGNYYYPMETYDDEVYVKNVAAGDEVTVPVTVSSGEYTPIVIYDAGATFVPPVVEEPTPEVPPVVDPEEPVAPASLGDIEDGGAVLAETVDAPDAAQDAASTDITVEGNKGAEARGEHVLVYVLAEGKTFADIQSALALGSGDLVADGIVLALGSATVDENGDYEIDMTLPNDVTSGSYDIVIDDETHEDALVYTAIAEKVAAYNAIVNGEANPFADVDLIISANDIYTGLTPEGKAAVEASVLAKDAVAALPAITEPNPGEYVGLENIATLGAIIDTRIAVEALNEGVDAAELALVYSYILPAADAESDDIVAVAAAIYADATALNATGKANVVAAISEQDYETKTVNGEQVSVKAQVAEDFAEAVFVELINNTGYTNINSVAAVVNDYIAADVFENLTSVSTTTLSAIVRDYTITSYADFETKVATVEGESDVPVQGGTEIVPSTPSTGGTTSGSMSNSTVEPTPVTPVTPAKKQLSDFVDANDASWAATALQTMLDRGILGGYEDNTIRPNNNATRQEVAKMLVEAFSSVRAGAWTGFADVPAGSWYYSYVATAQEDGIIKGVSDTEFGTDAMITREDLSVLIYRFLVNKGIKLDTSANRVFTDAANMSDYATDAINALANAGVVNGYGDGSFNPKGNATRAEIAQIIANVLVLYAL